MGLPKRKESKKGEREYREIFKILAKIKSTFFDVSCTNPGVIIRVKESEREKESPTNRRG